MKRIRLKIVSDRVIRLEKLRNALSEHCNVDCDLLNGFEYLGLDFDGVVIDVDLSHPPNAFALKTMFQRLGVQKRLFLVPKHNFVWEAQAYALGATVVIHPPFNKAQLMEHFRPSTPHLGTADTSNVRHAAMNCRLALSSMFDAARSGQRLNLASANLVADDVCRKISEAGLTNWLEDVRVHHEGTYQHCLLVMGIATDFADSLGFSNKDARKVGLGAYFHDIGKAKVPLNILDKPGPLNESERRIMEHHPADGHQILQRQSDVPEELLGCVRHHHEYLDGSGYPDGLESSQISDLVRMITISDIFAALIEKRTYKDGMSRSLAYDVLCNMTAKLDKSLVKAFKPTALSR